MSLWDTLCPLLRSTLDEGWVQAGSQSALQLLSRVSLRQDVIAPVFDKQAA